MQTVQLNVDFRATQKSQKRALLDLGFRIFFLGAGTFSVLSVAVWTAIYTLHWPVTLKGVSSFQWHAHEMIYGYAVAVIAGFLLTAVKNWTGLQTLNGKPLLLLFCLWAIARILFLCGTKFLVIVSLLDVLFMVLLIVSVAWPIMSVKQWGQLPIIGILLLLTAGNSAFYYGALQQSAHLVHIGVYGGLYLVLGLVLIMGRRVLPSFIEGGVGYEVTLFNARRIDGLIVLLYAGFVVAELIIKSQTVASAIAAGLFLLNAIRLLGWYTHGIWRKSLLWSLYVSFWLIALGFLLMAGVTVFSLSKYMAIHAITYGGIGLITLSMMSRVSLGHTGRDIGHPPRLIGVAFGVLIAGTGCRVVLPLLSPGQYAVWIGLAQLCWIGSFSIFLGIYMPMLIKSEIK